MPRLGKYPGFLEQFTVDGVRAPRKGELWRNPHLAATLQAMSKTIGGSPGAGQAKAIGLWPMAAPWKPSIASSGGVRWPIRQK